MKLHIPFNLRAALLSSIAAVTFTTTFTTGTIAVGVASYMLIQQQTQAVTIVYTGGDTFNPGDTTEEDLFIVDLTAGWFNNNNPTIAATTYIRNWDVSAISDSRSITFNNAIIDFAKLPADAGYVAPDGAATVPNFGIVYTTNTSGTNVGPATISFNGAMKDFSGNILSIGSALTLNFGNPDTSLSSSEDRLASASGKGKIVIGGRAVNYNMTGEVTVNNSLIAVSNILEGAMIEGLTVNGEAVERTEITADGGNALNPTLSFAGTATYDVSSIVIADNLSVAAQTTNTFTKAVTSTVSQSFLGTVTFAAEGNSLSGATSIAAGASVRVEAGASLTLNGTLTAHNVIENAGEISFGENFRINLSTLEFSDENVYTVINNTGIGSLTGFDTLNVDAIDGILKEGKDFTFHNDGTISFVVTAITHTYTGAGPLDWEIGTDFGEATTFKDNDILIINPENGIAELTITMPISSALVTINDDKTLDLSSTNTATNKLSGRIEVDGTLILHGDILDAESTITSTDPAVGGTVQFDIGAGETLNYETQLDTFAGAVVVESGTMQFTTAAKSNDATFSSITAEAGATLFIHDVNSGVDINLKGGSDEAAKATLNMAYATYTGLLTATGETAFLSDDLVYLTGGLTGSGTLSVSTTNSLHLQSNSSHTGTLNMEAGQLVLGSGDTITRTVNFDRITLNTNSQLYWWNGATSLKTLQMNGGNILVQDMNEDVALIQKLEMTADSTMSVFWNSQFRVNELTGGANLTFNSAGGTQVMDFEVTQIKDYNGTMDFSGLAERFELTIATINQNADSTAIIQNLGKVVQSNGLVMRGEGIFILGEALNASSMSLEQSGTFRVAGITNTDSFKQTGTGITELTALNINNNGLLYMGYNGSITGIAGAELTLALAANTTLVYGGETESLFNINAANITGLETLTLSVLEVTREDLAAGIDLGIAGDISETNIGVFGLTADQYQIELDDNTKRWTLIIDETQIFDFGGWDINWGVDVILGAPSTQVIEDGLVGTAGQVDNFFLFSQESTDGTPYTADGITTVTLTGGGRPTQGVNTDMVSVYGGASGGSTITDTWVNVQGGTFFTIGGGSMSGSFTGDTHIILNQTSGTVDYIVGGISQDSGSPAFTGDTYISIFTNTLQGSVIGGNTSMHSASPSLIGNTNIYIYSPLNLTTNNAIHSHGAGNLGANQIIGSSAWGANWGGTLTHTGNSNITVDLSGYTDGTTSFSKNIMGASYLDLNKNFVMSGSTHVKITGQEDVTFTAAIRGGSLIDQGTSNITGSTNVIVDGNGSTFEGRVIGADDIGAGGASSSTYSGTTNLTINSGIFTNVIVAGFNQHNHTAVSGGNNLTINGGTFNAIVMAGSFQDNGINTVNGDINLTITNGSFSSSVYGGSSASSGLQNDSTNTVTGKHNLVISGGVFTEVLVGGSQIGDSFVGKVDTQGGTKLLIEGGDFNGNIIGGHNRTSGAGNATTVQLMGDVEITLNGGKVGSNVYAAGWNAQDLEADAIFTTASTKVSISNGVVFDGSNQIIDGGFGGEGADSGSVTGSKTLAFSSAGTYENIDGVTFQNFDTVEVIEGASAAITITANNITKTGLGTLELGAQHHDSLTVDAGTLKLAEGAATSTLSAINVNSEGTLDLTHTNVGISGALSLTGTASLSMTVGNAIALGELHLDLGAGEKISLDLDGAVLSGTYNYTLFTGLSEDTITGIDFTLQTGQMAASAGDYLEGYSGFLVRNADGSISLVNSLVSEQIWGSGDGNINDSNWTSGNIGGQAFINELSYTFNEGMGDILINTAVDAFDFSIAGAAVSYNFTADATGSLVVDSLSVTGGASANFTMDNLELSDADISIEASSTLILGQSETLGSLNSSGTLDAGANDITLETSTASGGSLVAANLTLAEGDNSFAQLSISNTVTSTGILSLGGVSTIQILSGGGLAVVGASSTLTLGTVTTLSSFSSEGAVTANAGLSITNKVTQGGTLSVGALGLSEGASFTQLTAGAVTNTSGVVSVGGSSTMTSLSGGGLEVRESGTLTLGAATSINTLNNLGTIISTGELSISSGEVVGGILTVGAADSNANLTLSADANASNTFSKLTVNGNVIGHDGTLTLGGGSVITGSLNGGALVTTGDVSIGSNAAGVRSLSNGTGTFSLGGNLLVGTSGLLNEGIIDVAGTVTLLAETAQGGHLDATGNVTLAGASNSFNSVNTDGTITGTTALSVNANSSAASVDEMALTINGGASVMTISTDDTIVLTSLSGTGSLELTGNSALTLKEASSGKNLSVIDGNITLGGALNLSGTLSVAAPQLALTLDYDPDINTPAISTATLGANKLNLSITNDQLEALGLSNITTYTLVDVDTALSNTFSLEFNNSGSTEYQLNSSTMYTLSLNANGDIIISVSISGNEWNGASGAKWDDSVANWTKDLPDANKVAFFFGGGTSSVEVVGSQTAMQLQVSAAAQAEGKYSFSGGSIATEQLSVTSGEMDMSNSITVAEGVNADGNTAISGNAALNILAGGTLSTDSLRVAADGELHVKEGANLFVGENGVSTLGTGTISNEGFMSITGDSDISNLEGTGTLTIGGASSYSFDHLTQDSLTIEEGSTLIIKENGTLTISGAVANKGSIDGSAADTTINVTASALEGGGISTDTLSVSGQGASFEDVRVNTLQLKGELTAGALATRNAPTPLLVANSLSSLNAGTITLDVDQLSASLNVGSYYLVDTADTLTWDMVNLDADTRSELNKLIYSGKDVAFSTDNSSLSFTVTEATERRWLMSNNYAASGNFTPGATPENTINPIVNSSQQTGLTEGSIVSNDILDSVQLVYLDVDYTLKFDQVAHDATSKTEGLIIRNLSGANAKTLTLEGDGINLDKATLSNDLQTTVDYMELKGMSVDIIAHSADGKLFIDQKLTVDNSALTIKDSGELEVGSIVLTEGTISVENGELTATSLTLDTASQLSVQTDATVDISSLTTAGDTALSFNGGSSVIDELALKGDATLAVAGTDTSVIVKDMSSSETSSITGHVQLGGGDYTGTYGMAGATLEVLANATASMVTGANLSLIGNAGSTITLNSSAASGNKLASIATTDSTLILTENGVELSQSSTMTGGTLSFKLDSTEVTEMLNTNASAEQIFTNTSQLTLSGVDIVLGQSDSNYVMNIGGIIETKNRVIAIISDDGSTSSDVSVTLTGPAFSKYFTNARYENGNLVADLNTEAYTSKVSSSNGKAGAVLLNDVLISLNPQWMDAGETKYKYPELAGVLNALDKATGAEADRLASAVAGASVTSLGGSMLASVDRQLQNMRNRSKSTSEAYFGEPNDLFSNAWISAEGGHTQADAQGTCAGYDYSSYGGSFGVDMRLDQTVTLGVAATALYGSVDAQGPDTATGDLNTYMLSAYARITSKNWNHSFAITTSMAETSLERTVNYAGGSYTSQGDSNGWGLGMVYELGYTYMLNEEATSLLQPIFNISFVNAGIDGYTENGSEASLIVGDQESSYVSFGFGTRLETAVGENTFNRAGVLKLHAMVKADAGDRYTSADVSFVNNAGATGTIEGAEVGAVGIELGAGLDIPIGGENASMFMDAAVELRDGQNNVNGTVGCRFSF